MTCCKSLDLELLSVRSHSVTANQTDTHAGRTLVDSNLNTLELAKIFSGQLFAVRPGGARTTRECMYALRFGLA